MGRKALVMLARQWIPLVVLVALVFGGVVVYQLHGVFGSQPHSSTRAGSERIVSTTIKTVTYEVIGPPGTAGPWPRS